MHQVTWLCLKTVDMSYYTWSIWLTTDHCSQIDLRLLIAGFVVFFFYLANDISVTMLLFYLSVNELACLDLLMGQSLMDCLCFGFSWFSWHEVTERVRHYPLRNLLVEPWFAGTILVLFKLTNKHGTWHFMTLLALACMLNLILPKPVACSERQTFTCLIYFKSLMCQWQQPAHHQNVAWIKGCNILKTDLMYKEVNIRVTNLIAG